jgi:hypothetical protein
MITTGKVAKALLCGTLLDYFSLYSPRPNTFVVRCKLCHRNVRAGVETFSFNRNIVEGVLAVRPAIWNFGGTGVETSVLHTIRPDYYARLRWY